MNQTPETTKILNGYPKKNKVSIADIAKAAGVRKPILYRQLSENDPYGFPVKNLIPFMKACNNDTEILDHLNREMGRVAIPVAAEPCNPTELAAAFGDALAAYAACNGSKTKARNAAKKLHHLTRLSMGAAQTLTEN